MPIDALALCDVAPCAMMLVDPGGRVLFANRKALSWLRAVPSELTGASFLDHVSEHHREMVRDGLRTGTFALDVTLLTREGELLEAHVCGTLAAGGVCVMAQDRSLEIELRTQAATAREATEFQLSRAAELAARNEQLLKALDGGEPTLSTHTVRLDEAFERALQAGGLVSWHWDAIAGSVGLRGTVDAYFGFRPRDMQEIRSCLEPRDRDVLWQAIDRARKEHVGFDLRLRFAARDGMTRLMRVTGQPREDLRGDVVGADGLMVDETERERERSDIEQLDQDLRLTIESMSDGLLLIDRDWRIKYINRRGGELISRKPGELAGKSLRHAFPQGTGESFARANRKTMSERVPTEVEDRYDPLDRIFVNRVYPTVQGIAMFFHDVTERRRRQEKLQRSEQRLRELGVRMREAREEEAKRIAREIHDDLGQALTALKMDIARVRTRASDPKLVADQLRDMDAVVDAALATTRRIAGDLRPTILDDLGLGPAIAWHAERVAARSGFECVVDVPPEDVAIDAAGATVLYRVLQEALTNVTRHAHARHVTVTLKEKPDGVVLEVRDDGQGYDPHAPTRSYGLMGMRERVAEVGGSLELESARRQGSLVRASVPRRLDRDSNVGSSAEALPQGEGPLSQTFR